MKLGISYNVFDGFEMLEASAKTIKPSVDFINVVVQRVSNHNITMPQTDWDELIDLIKRLQSEDIIDNAVMITPKYGLAPWTTEIGKRQLGYDICAKNDCTHYISMDVDEFYNPVDLDRVKPIIEANNYDGTVCRLIDYYGDMNHHYPKYSGTYVPFIYKIIGNRFFRSGSINTREMICDHTRQIPCNNLKIMDPETEIMMHHGTMVRKNAEAIRVKMVNSSANINFNDTVINNMVDYYHKWFESDKKFGAHIEHSPYMTPSIKHMPLTFIENDWIWKPDNLA